MLSALRVKTADVFEPLLAPSRYKGAWGGRGSGKSWFFATMAVMRAYSHPGTRGLMVREVQKSLQQSAKQLIEDTIARYELGGSFNILKDRIETPGGGLFAFIGMQDHTADSAKSFEGFDFAWVEEAQGLSKRSLTLLRPTIRKPGSELWFGWNPRSETDPVDQLLRSLTPPTDSMVVRANWSDNPWFPPELDRERLDDLAARPELYGHIWEGEYEAITEGAYFARELQQARADGRIGPVEVDALLPVKAYWDLGISDTTAIWVVQTKASEIVFADYIQGSGQPLGFYLNELRRRGWERAECVLPHDGAHRNVVTGLRFEDHVRDGGFAVRTIPNMGKGAAIRRIEAARRWFGRMRFDEGRCGAGLSALGSYHERRDEKRQYGLGPEHDWASHAADAFGLAAIDYTEPSTGPVIDWVASAPSANWMAA